MTYTIHLCIVFQFQPQQSLSVSAQQAQLQQLQLLQAQLVQQSQISQDGSQAAAAAAQQPIIDTTLLAQIQLLTNQLLGGKDKDNLPEPQFNKVRNVVMLSVDWSRLLVTLTDCLYLA